MTENPVVCAPDDAECANQAQEDLKHRVFLAIGLVVIIWAIGIVLFHSLEQWGWTDSAFYSAATLTTVGYGDLVPKTHLGRILAIPFMFFGVAMVLYSVSIVGSYYAEKQFENLSRRGIQRLNPSHLRRRGIERFQDFPQAPRLPFGKRKRG